ncbi:hypothetical protein [Dyadobacter sp. Leaf189]|uniref:hypothetical protein n=1 Tax=Dyadobacter sp. Leaf189 TaxID=1736295 RepID=UPI0006F1C5A3|nr:hypothetical protein [Dyadobacter sp. Leaf189]KQS27965.1 hypothetical protein ASG33_16325 [Dyadobacter sp. Leaf189]
MDKNQHTLKNAIAKLPGYTPAPQTWDSIGEKLGEEPLRKSLQSLPEYTPAPMVWDAIERKAPGRGRFAGWQYAAAILIAGISGLLVWREVRVTHVYFAQEQFDPRLQVSGEMGTDQHYELLKAYCETETLVCNSGRYKRLREEFETLHSASSQLQEAIGQYNTEPELMKQLNTIEKQKAAILNEMAKMI